MEAACMTCVGVGQKHRLFFVWRIYHLECRLLACIPEALQAGLVRGPFLLIGILLLLNLS